MISTTLESFVDLQQGEETMEVYHLLHFEDCLPDLSCLMTILCIISFCWHVFFARSKAQKRLLKSDGFLFLTNHRLVYGETIYNTTKEKNFITDLKFVQETKLKDVAGVYAHIDRSKIGKYIVQEFIFKVENQYGSGITIKTGEALPGTSKTRKSMWGASPLGPDFNRALEQLHSKVITILKQSNQ